jgi:P27 family predicted phage terminase small subunit
MPTPRKHEKLHELQGTKPHDRVLEQTPSTLPAGRPKFPRELDREAKRIFKSLCATLAERRALTSGEAYLLTLAAQIWLRRARAQAKLLEQGEICTYVRLDSNGAAHQMEKPNLWLKVATDCERQLVAILDRLGLSPMAGSKVKQTADSPEKAPAKPGTIRWILEEAEKKREAANGMDTAAN